MTLKAFAVTFHNPATGARCEVTLRAASEDEAWDRAREALRHAALGAMWPSGRVERLVEVPS